MTPITASAVLQPVDYQHYIQAATSELATASLAGSAPWLYSALSQLHELEDSGRVVPGVGDLRVSNAASTRMRMLLSLIEVRELLAPVLYPISGQGIGMRWNVGRREVEFTVFADGNTVMARLENSDLVGDTELRGDVHAEVGQYLGWVVGAR
jgi:hypothetical protein